MNIIEGKFKKDIPANEFLATCALRAQDQMEKGRNPKVVVVFFENGQPLEVTSSEQYPDGVFMTLHLAAAAIINETLGVTGETE
tara:strand:+ start:1989 stop:2240 length:252 start_codon:yes stop_codon:yes gene_type:complete